MAVEQFTGKLACANGIIDVITARSIRQQGVFIERQYIEKVGFIGILSDIGPADRDGDDLCAAGFECETCLFIVFVFPGTDQEA